MRHVPDVRRRGVGLYATHQVPPAERVVLDEGPQRGIRMKR